MNILTKVEKYYKEYLKYSSEFERAFNQLNNATKDTITKYRILTDLQKAKDSGITLESSIDEVSQLLMDKELLKHLSHRNEEVFFASKLEEIKSEVIDLLVYDCDHKCVKDGNNLICVECNFSTDIFSCSRTYKLLQTWVNSILEQNRNVINYTNLNDFDIASEEVQKYYADLRNYIETDGMIKDATDRKDDMFQIEGHIQERKLCNTLRMVLEQKQRVDK